MGQAHGTPQTLPVNGAHGILNDAWTPRAELIAGVSLGKADLMWAGAPGSERQGGGSGPRRGTAPFEPAESTCVGNQAVLPGPPDLPLNTPPLKQPKTPGRLSRVSSPSPHTPGGVGQIQSPIQRQDAF